jgi:hypothetical protein
MLIALLVLGLIVSCLTGALALALMVNVRERERDSATRRFCTNLFQPEGPLYLSQLSVTLYLQNLARYQTFRRHGSITICLLTIMQVHHEQQ